MVATSSPTESSWTLSAATSIGPTRHLGTRCTVVDAHMPLQTAQICETARAAGIAGDLAPHEIALAASKVTKVLIRRNG